MYLELVAHFRMPFVSPSIYTSRPTCFTSSTRSTHFPCKSFLNDSHEKAYTSITRYRSELFKTDLQEKFVLQVGKVKHVGREVCILGDIKGILK